MIKPIRITLKQKCCFVMIALLVLIVVVRQAGPLRPSPAHAAGPPALAGRVIDSQGEPVHGAEVAAYLNGLPEQKMSCSNLAPDAIRAAIENYRCKHL